MNIEKFSAAGKDVTLYRTDETDCPLIVLNNYADEGKAVIEAAENLGRKDFNLLCVGGLDWNRDMSPWKCPPIYHNEEPFTGGADEYLKSLEEKIIPEGLKRMAEMPSRISIAGYSLAGLFALYALYRTDLFDRAASMSGSLWFPDFREYVLTHKIKRKPDKIYLSLGDKEAKTRNQYMKSVQENTESIAEHYRKAGIDTVLEMNPGNHFRDADLRIAKGIIAVM
ncbi:MAG: alpha/beta hydrolase [Mogibacterium sp.]|nr:alpha/beta hydrolase [Mogibacterium sp.]